MRNMAKSKFNGIDILYQVFLFIVIGYITYGIILLLNPLIYLLNDSIFIVKVFLALFTYYILLVLIYPFIITRFYKIKEGEFDFKEKSINRFWWGQLSFAYVIGIDILEKLLPVIIRDKIYKILGAKMGRGIMCSGYINEPWIVEIGDNCILGRDSFIMPHAIITTIKNERKVILKKTILKNNSTLGARAIIMSGCILGENSIVGVNSTVVPNTIIPDNEFWAGSPAKFVKKIN